MSTPRALWLVLLFVSFAGGVSAEDAPSYDPAWVKCSADKDCVAVPGACGWVAVHEAHSGDMQAYQQSVAPYVECASGTRAMTEPPHGRCLQNACTVKVDVMALPD